MRVTSYFVYSQSAADITRTATELAERQREVSSGKRIGVPRDDPSGAATAVRERSETAALDQYSSVADSSSSRLAVIDTVLGDTLDRITQARTSILSARGSSKTAAQREAAASELEGLRDALASNFNTTFRGTYLFSGIAATTTPYQRQPSGSMSAYQGNAAVTSVDLDPQTQVQITYSADAIARGTDADDLFVEIDRAIAAVRAGDEPGMQSASVALDRSFGRASAAQSHVGTSMNAIETLQSRTGDLRRASQSRLSRVESANMAESITKMNQADVAYQSALGAISRIGRVSLMDYLR